MVFGGEEIEIHCVWHWLTHTAGLEPKTVPKPHASKDFRQLDWSAYLLQQQPSSWQPLLSSPSVPSLCPVYGLDCRVISQSLFFKLFIASASLYNQCVESRLAPYLSTPLPLLPPQPPLQNTCFLAALKSLVLPLPVVKRHELDAVVSRQVLKMVRRWHVRLPQSYKQQALPPPSVNPSDMVTSEADVGTPWWLRKTQVNQSPLVFPLQLPLS